MKTATNSRSSTNSLTVRALRVTQDKKIPVYTFFLTAADLLQIAEISRVKRNKDGDLRIPKQEAHISMRLPSM